MTYDYKQLCAELHAALEKHDLSLADDQLLDRSAAALRAALVEPVGPTDEELFAVAEAYAEDNGLIGLHNAPDFARAVLARWGNHPGSPDSSTPQPVTVSERLPGDELCWWYEPDEDDGYGGMWTLLRIRGGTARYSHWLPAHALPQPS